METKEYLTLKDVSELLKLDEETVRRWSVNGKIPASKIGHFWRYRKVDIDTWFDGNGK